jgi:hypothetical protein
VTEKTPAAAAAAIEYDRPMATWPGPKTWPSVGAVEDDAR